MSKFGQKKILIAVFESFSVFRFVTKKKNPE